MSEQAPPDLAIYVEDLDGGGVQAMRLRIARELIARGRSVELLVGRAHGALLDKVPERARVTPIPAASRLASAARLIRSPAVPGMSALAALRARDPDHALRHVPALVAYLDRRQPRTLLAAQPYRNLEALQARELARHRPRVVVSEHNDLHDGHPLGQGRSRVYPGADAVVAVSQGVAADVARRSGLAPERIAIVYNPAVPPDVAARCAAPVPHPWLEQGPPVVLSVGRLGAAKDLPMLLRAFARLRAKREARLLVIGKHQDARKTAKRIATLRAASAKLGIANDVDFPGFSPNPFAWMARAAVLAVASRHEGFCNVIAEALAAGCPVVSTDCPSGPAEILDHGGYGRLVPVGDDAAMAEALAATLDQPADPEPLRRRAELFSLARAVDGYERLLFEPLES